MVVAAPEGSTAPEAAGINDMIVPGSSYWNVALAREAGKVVEDSEAMATVDRFAENLAWLAARCR